MGIVRQTFSLIVDGVIVDGENRPNREPLYDAG
jgi:hypothetical protein